jgi:hypothetical protein
MIEFKYHTQQYFYTVILCAFCLTFETKYFACVESKLTDDVWFCIVTMHLAGDVWFVYV